MSFGMITWKQNIEKMQNYVMDTDRFTAYIKTEDIYSDIAKDFETRFDTSNYELNRPLPKGKKWKSNWFDERRIRWENNERICCTKS